MHNIWQINLYERKSSKQVKQSDVVVCNACRENNQKKCELKISDGSLSSLIRHLKQHEEYKQKFDKLENKSGEMLAMERFVVRPSGGLSSLDKKVINYVAENCVSFNSIKSHSFISLFSSTNSSEKLKKRRHYSEYVLPRAYEAVTSLVKSKLDMCPSLSFTTDIWTSQSGHSFFSLTSHGIDSEWKRVKYILAIKDLPESPSGANIDRAIEKILEEWSIPRSKCHVFLRDRAANMKKAFKGSFKHADCAAHKINLAVKATISSGSPSIEEGLKKTLLPVLAFRNLATVVDEPAAKKPRSLFACQMNINQEEGNPRPATTWTQNLQFEIIAYNAEMPIPLESDPLAYWQKNMVRFPLLSKAARRYLSAPPTSQPSEQLFSHARDVFHYKRSQLDSFNAEQLIFLNRSLYDVNFTY